MPNLDDVYLKHKENVRNGKYLEDHEQEHVAAWEPYQTQQDIFKEPLFPVDVNQVRDYWYVSGRFG